MRLVSVMGLALAAAVVVPMAKADGMLFNLGAVNGATYREAGDGVGQGVSVGTTTALSGIAFDLVASGGADVKYMIFSGDDRTLLYSQTVTVAAGTSVQWVTMTGVNYTLQAGQTYFFGVVADNTTMISYLAPQMNYSANGLSALESGNTNYQGYQNPEAVNGGAAQIGLELFGTQTPVAATPEPATLSLLGTGVLAGAGVVRRRRTAA